MEGGLEAKINEGGTSVVYAFFRLLLPSRLFSPCPSGNLQLCVLVRRQVRHVLAC